MIQFYSKLNRYLRLGSLLWPLACLIPLELSAQELSAQQTDNINAVNTKPLLEAAEQFEAECKRLDASKPEKPVEIWLEPDASSLSGFKQRKISQTAETAQLSGVLQQLLFLAELGGLSRMGVPPTRLLWQSSGLIWAQENQTGKNYSKPCAGLRALVADIAANAPGVPPYWRAQSGMLAQMPLPPLLQFGLQILPQAGIELMQRGREFTLKVPSDITSIIGPPGSVIRLVKSEQGQNAILHLDHKTKTGLNELRFYKGTEKLQPSQRQRIWVLSGAEHSPSPTPLAASKTLTFGEKTEAVLEKADAHLYHINLEAAQSIQLISSGATDLQATLRNAAGENIAADDDGAGNAYNFALQQNLPAGNYTLEVTHCCSGSGAYGISLNAQ